MLTACILVYAVGAVAFTWYRASRDLDYPVANGLLWPLSFALLPVTLPAAYYEVKRKKKEREWLKAYIERSRKG